MSTINTLARAPTQHSKFQKHLYVPTLDRPHKATVGIRCGFSLSKRACISVSVARIDCRCRTMAVLGPKGRGGLPTPTPTPTSSGSRDEDADPLHRSNRRAAAWRTGLQTCKSRIYCNNLGLTGICRNWRRLLSGGGAFSFCLVVVWVETKRCVTALTSVG